MHRNRREAELLFATIYAGIPLYGAESGSHVAVAVSHVVLGLLLLRALFFYSDKGVPPTLLKAAAIGYLAFFPFDAAMLSSLILASTHLVFFIAVYQALDRPAKSNHAQRLLIALLICIISLATTTTLSIVFFLLGFVILTFRQLIELTHSAAAEDAGIAPIDELPKSAALTYLVPTALIAASLFPALPRVHNPLVRGFMGALEGSSTGLSESIDFSVARSISPDPTVIARVWMPQDVVPFFTPLRLRGSIYDSWTDHRWKASGTAFGRRVPVDRAGRFAVARPSGFSRTVMIQQSLGRDNKLFLPVGTHHVKGIPRLDELGHRSLYFISSPSSASRGVATYEAELSRRTLPLEVRPPRMPNYPIQPRVAALAAKIVGDAKSVDESARRIEEYLSTKFQYVPDPATIGRAFTVDEFLLRERRGHCEYFAAGMVVLLEARGIPSRIVGGFYGGKLNPLTGYFTIQKSDAHAWVEVWDGTTWSTFDPTPPSLRPGNLKQGLVRAYASAVADSVNYFWDRYILTFGLQDQVALMMQALESTRGMVRSARAELASFRGRLLSLPGIAALLGVAVAFVLLRRFLLWRQPLFARTVDELKRAGFAINDATTPDEMLGLVKRQRPELAPHLSVICETYQRERFSNRLVTVEEKRRARESFRKLVVVAS